MEIPVNSVSGVGPKPLESLSLLNNLLVVDDTHRCCKVPRTGVVNLTEKLRFDSPLGEGVL
jgi:hypothetical protein